MTSNGAADVVHIDGKKYRRVREGLASVLAPYGAERESAPSKQVKNNDEGSQAVFYNPIQQFNRDLTVLAITIYGEGAVAEKAARFKQKSGKDRREKKKQKTALRDEEQSVQDATTEQNPRKRKADDLQEIPDAASTLEPAKRVRTDEGQEGEDELIVQPLVADSGSLPRVLETKPLDQAHSEQLEEPAEVSKEKDAPRARQTPFTILDALSATGLRAFRYAKEIPFATNIVANDISPEAVKIIETNIDHNEVKDKVHSNLGDARAFMYSKVGNEHQRQSDGYVHRFDVVDLDPYGTAAPFFDASLQALQDGGLLCVTCTDAGVFASTGYSEKAFALYAGLPVKGPHSHEGGLRLILNALAVSGAKYGIAIEPLLSLYIDYYARVFVRVHKKQQDVKLLAGTTMTVYSCAHGCGSWTTQPLLRNQPQKARNGDLFYKYLFAQAPTAGPNCTHCGFKTHLCGPVWAGPLHNPHFVQRMLDRIPSLDKKVYGTTDRLQGMLTLALEEDLTTPDLELPIEAPVAKEGVNCIDSQVIPRTDPSAIDNAPFFIMPSLLAKVIHCSTPPEGLIRSAIRSLGYRTTRSHCKAGTIKTNAPWTVIWEIIREFMRTKAPIREGAVKKGTPGWTILARMRDTEMNFVADLKDGSKTQIERCETKEDLRTVLQGMLYRLDSVNTGGAAKAKESSTTPDATAIDDATGDKPLEPEPRPRRSQSPETLPPSKLQIVFDEKLGKEKPRGKLVRYQMNPRENWGPMNRASHATS